MRSSLLSVLSVASSKLTYPTGNPEFSVQQAFPSGLSAELADPFLMCDFFSARSKGVLINPDEFEVPWHPHRGQDIATYMRSGVGRHADSMGNRETFETPGMQWISVGSGIEHAESGGTPEGVLVEGFQIWINVPAANKMDDPKYGTEPSSKLPLFMDAGVSARVLAGRFQFGNQSFSGPFQTKQPVQMVDVEVDKSTFEFEIDSVVDNVIAYVYRGSGSINGAAVKQNSVVHLDGSKVNRLVQIKAEEEKIFVMIFAGKRLNQPIAWHGPFVMNTQEEIRQTLKDYQYGKFPPKRVPWDYKRLADFPASHFKE